MIWGFEGKCSSGHCTTAQGQDVIVETYVGVSSMPNSCLCNSTVRTSICQLHDQIHPKTPKDPFSFTPIFALQLKDMKMPINGYL